MSGNKPGGSPGSPGDTLGGMGVSRPQETSPRMTPADGGVRPQRRWMTAQWGARREVYLRRLGEWMWTTRSRLGLSLADLARLARSQGEFVSTSQLSRMELLRQPERDAASRQIVSLTAVAYLAALAGQTLADVDTYLRAGDVAALDPALSSRAETVRTAFLTLSPARQRALEDFAQYLFELDLAEQGVHDIATSGTPKAPSAASSVASRRDTQRTLDELHTTVDAALHTWGQSGAPADDEVGEAGEAEETEARGKRSDARRRRAT